MTKRTNLDNKLSKTNIFLALGSLLLGIIVGMNIRSNEVEQPSERSNNYAVDSHQEPINENTKVFSTAVAVKPESILQSMYNAQLDCMNTYDVDGTPAAMGSCSQMTNVYTMNNQNLEVNCSKQNVPGKEQITINPATIKGDTANITVDTNWAGGKPTDVVMKLIDNRWRVASISCRN